ncbi:hypothetical protein ACGF8B_37380 [Streptomyces sp. NPDC047917]|uniref:hypothetical protein n=1 Tax=Streptomyces sp. NPDC047917 TaxID=3365491 RepID=UPI003714C8FA
MDENPPWPATEFAPGPSLGEAVRAYGPLEVRRRCEIGAGTERVAVVGNTVCAGRSHPSMLLAPDSRTGRPRWEAALRDPSALPWGEDEARTSSEIHISGRTAYFTALGLYSFRIDS